MNVVKFIPTFVVFVFSELAVLEEMSSTGSIASSRQSMTVVVRMRGVNEKERDSRLPVVAKAVDEKVIVFDPKIQTSPEYHRGRKRSFRDMTKRINRNVFFAFDRVFDETASNLEVFSYTTEAIVTDVLNGYNACGAYMNCIGSVVAELIYLCSFAACILVRLFNPFAALHAGYFWRRK